MAGVKRKAEIEIPIADDNDLLKITPLGAGNEVGRSSILLEYKGKTILLDAGIHPAYNGLASLPFFDEIDPASIDLLLVTHFHVDHAASVPYLMERTSFKGRVFMTHPTKAIYKWLLSDYLRVSNIGDEDQLYTEEDLINSFHRIEAVDYHQQVEVEGIKFTGYNAGHVLGAAMFLIEIAGVKVLYTGDYSREEDRHLMAAEKPEGTVDVLITESTYGVQSHEPRLAKEIRFTSLVHDIVGRGGRCLMPVFALGRAQELLLILDEYWEAHPELDSIPIYYASSLAKKCMAVYQTYINMMNARIRKQFTISNPFVFKHISNLKNVEQFEDSGPCVMMASPGMLQNGLSRELFERWAPDKKNGLVITGYCVENTLARQAMNEPSDFTAMDGRRVPLRMSVDYISFSAHVDFTQNSKFIDDVKAPHVILVHGEANAMYRLKSALQSKYSEREENVKIYTPKNCDTVKLLFRGEKMAKTIGRLAEKYPTENQPLNGVIVSKDFQLNIMSPEDLNELAGLITTVVTQRQVVPFNAGVGLLKWHLEMMFGPIHESDLSKADGNDNQDATVMRVFDTVDIKKFNNRPNQVVLEWIGNAMNDMVADSVLAVILSIDSSPASVKASSRPCTHTHAGDNQELQHSSIEEQNDREFEDVVSFLEEQFGEVTTDAKERKATVTVDGEEAYVDCVKFNVESDNEGLQKRVANVLHHVKMAIKPISEIYECFA
ncbi:beta-lactamase-like protein [Radiomyces spectabilis]|uniref:beta-lactamase-like protein n=1 Tax=Radiomyces spectabilis TaxID=64574 RepID=UPI0022201860|nr:beta-lactamase-like protein [Radiomyces spectabilis]KAI8366660.1 beta-lactamase-like protein [Radiomyces spectabilis]